MPYGTIKVDTVTFTDSGVDKSVSISGLVQNPTFSGNVTVTGTISGVTVTGTTASFTSGNFTNISVGTYTTTSGVFSAGSETNPSITFTGDLNTGIYSPGADQLAISTNGTRRLIITSDGKVGLGSASVLQQGSGIDGGSGAGILELYDGATGNTTLENTGAFPIIFKTNGSERMRLDSSGRLGLGTSSPTSLLTVGASSTANPAADVTVNSSTVDQYRLKLTSSAYNADTKWLGLGFGYHDNYLKAGIIAEAKDNNARTNLHFCLDGNANNNNANLGDSKMVITYDGNVGIGTTSPSSKLSIVTSANSPAFDITDASTSDFIITPGVSSGVCRVGPATGAMSLYTANTERARIDSSGRLLVGTSSARGLVIGGNSTNWQGRVQTSTTSIGTGIGFTAISWSDYSTDLGGGSGTSDIVLARSNSNTEGTQVAVTNGMLLGRINFNGSDGTAFANGAYIAAASDGQTWASGDCPTRLVFSTTADGASSPTERMRIDSTGKVGGFDYYNGSPYRGSASYQASGHTFTRVHSIDSTSNTWSSQRSGLTAVCQGGAGGNGQTGTVALTCVIDNAGAGNPGAILRGWSGEPSATPTLNIQIAANGNVTNTNNSYGSLSDIRLKTNIQPASSQWSDLKELNVVNFEFASDSGYADGNKYLGLIAQEAESVSPGLVETSPDEAGIKSVKYSVLYMKAVKALQEAMERIETLESKVAALEGV
jgi:hypothetical protein